MFIKMSVVVPVYNVENYLEKCLDSLVNQTLNEIEIICINDGSTDNSLEILEKYASLDNRVKVFSFVNKGLGPSRNRGIKRSNGEYVAFIDSDDWVELDFCEKIYNHAKHNDADIVLFNAIEEYDTHQRERIYFPNNKIEDPYNFTFDYNFDKNLLMNNFITAWSKVHKTSFLKENNLKFPPRIFEDNEFQVDSFLKAKRISYNPGIFYHYRKQNPTSITSKANKREGFILLKIIKEIENILIKNNAKDLFEIEFIKYKLGQLFSRLKLTDVVFKEEFFQLIKNEFLENKIESYQLDLMPIHLKEFYLTVMESDHYWIYSKNELISNIENKNLNLSNQFKFSNNLKDDKEIENILLNEIQIDLLDTNFNNLKVFEMMLDEGLFNNQFYLNKYNYSHNLNPLLYELYIGYKHNNNPTPFFDSEFYKNEYKLHDSLNPLMYYMLCGRFEGKNKLNKNIHINSINQREVMHKIHELNINHDSDNIIPNLIVSLTSFPQRINELHFTLYSIFNQTLKPKFVVLNLAEDEFPNKEYDLPSSILKFKDCGLVINWTENLKAYKKLIPTLKKFPDYIIVTVDDDIYLNEKWLEILYNDYLKYPDCIIAHRSRKIKFSDGGLDEYSNWDILYSPEEPSFLNFSTNGAGTLFPPYSLDEEIFNVDVFKELCFLGDDIWYWAMAVKNNTKIKVSEECIPYLIAIDALRDLEISNKNALWLLNKGQNDIQIKKVLNKYPEILDIIQDFLIKDD